ncbi:hypothetical protein HK096_011510, partial [Nowakowskiella sp. JEL0078]
MSDKDMATFQKNLEKVGVKNISRYYLYNFPGTGRGLQTKQEIKKDEVILTVPKSLLWSVDSALAHPILGRHIKDMSGNSRLSVDDTLSVFLLYVKLKGDSKATLSDEESIRYQHIQHLPTSYNSSVFFSEDDLEIGCGSELVSYTKALRAQIQNDYDIIADYFRNLDVQIPTRNQ